MDIQDKRSGSIFQNFDRGNVSTNDKCHYAIVFKTLRMIQEFGPGSFFRILASAKPQPITMDLLNTLGLELVNIKAYDFFFFSEYRPWQGLDKW